MKKVLLLTFVLAVASVPLTFAHEGHGQKIMGTVSSIHDTQLEVKGTNGKTSMIVLDEKTKVLKGKAAMKRTDLKEGDRVVVTAMPMKGADGKTMLMAEQVSLGAAPSAKAKK